MAKKDLSPALQAAITQLSTTVGVGIAESTIVYLPSIMRLGTKELASWIDLVFNQKKYQEALDQLHAIMTPQELADEKDQLATMTAMVADSNAEKWSIAHAFWDTIFKACITVLFSTVLPAVLL